MKHKIQIILHGGDGLLEDQLTMILDQINQKYITDKAIGYMAIGLEPLLSFSEIRDTFSKKITPFILSRGAKTVTLITKEKIKDMGRCSVVIIAGGDTSYLLEDLKNSTEIEAVKKGRTSVKVLAGISAGAIALAKKGLGVVDRFEVVFEGLNFVDCFVIPHAKGRKEGDRSAVCLGDDVFVSDYSIEGEVRWIKK